MALPEIDREQRIFQTNVNQVTNWAQVSGSTLVEYKEEVRRGFDLGGRIAAGVEALLNKWLNLRLFAEIGGEVTLRAQAQTPLDLFEEAGLAVRLQAIARLAVGVGLDFQLTVGQLIDQLERRPDVRGLPARLLMTLLSEVSLRGELYGQAAIAVMAYLDLVATGSLLSTEYRPAGFNMVFDYGMGFKAGGGYRLALRAEFARPRRLVVRVTDLLVSELIRAAARGRELGDVEVALRLGTRLAYEVGQRLSDRADVTSAEVSRTAIEIVVQEGQRLLFDRLAQFGRSQMAELLTGPHMRMEAEAVRLVQSLLSALPADPSGEQLAELVQAVAKAAPAMPGIERRRAWEQAAAMLWAAYTLRDQLAEHIREEEGRFSPTGAVGRPVPGTIAAWINALDSVSLEDLAGFLLEQPLTLWLERQPEAAALLRLFTPALGETPVEAARALLRFQGADDPQEMLRDLLGHLQALVGPRLTAQVDRLMQQSFPGQEEVKALFEYGLIPALEMAVTVVLPQLAETSPGGLDRKETIEALSAPLIPLVGRTVLQIFETIMLAVQQRIADLIQQLADRLDELGVIRALGPTAGILEEPLQAALGVLARELAAFPLLRETFQSAYKVVSPLEAGAAERFAAQLNRPDWLPQGEEMLQLANALSSLLYRTMGMLTMRILPLMLEAFLRQLLEELQKLIQQVADVLARLREAAIKSLGAALVAPLTGQFLSLVSLSGFSLPSVPGIPLNIIQDTVNEAIRNAVTERVQGLIPNLLGSLGTLDVEPVLEALRNQDPRAFQESIINQLTAPLTNLPLEIDLTVPVTFRVDMPFPIPDITASRTLRLGGFTLPTGQVVDLVRQTLTTSFQFGSFFQVLLPLAQPVFRQQGVVAAFEQAMPNILREFQSFLESRPGPPVAHRGEGDIPQPEPVLQTASTLFPAVLPEILPPVAVVPAPPVIGLRFLPTAPPSVEAWLHYPGLEGAGLWPGRVAIFLNNQPVPLQWVRHVGQGGPGLLLVGVLRGPLLRPGPNTLYTVAFGPHGERVEASRLFMA